MLRTSALLIYVTISLLLPRPLSAPPDPLPPIPDEFADAAAIVLEDRQTWEIVPKRSAIYRVFERTLIRDPRGYDEANRTIAYNADSERLDWYTARTVQSDGTIQEVPEALFHEVVLFKAEGFEIRGIQFTFPAVSPGTVLELSYRITEETPRRRRVWQAQRNIPVIDSSFSATLKLPAHIVPLQFFPAARGLVDDTCEITDHRNKKGARATRLAMQCRNLPAHEPEPNSPPSKDILVSVSFLWGPADAVDKDWHRRTDEWYAQIREFIQKCRGCDALASELTQGAGSEPEKVDRILDWTRDHLELRAPPTSEVGGQIALHYESPDDVIQNRGGWPNEVTLLVMALLEEAEVATVPALAADRSQGKFLFGAMDMPGRLMLIANVEGAPIPLDPSCRACSPGIVDWRYADPTGPSGVTLSQFAAKPLWLKSISPSHNMERRIERVVVLADGRAHTKGQSLWTGQLSVDLRRRWKDLPESARVDDFLGDLRGDIQEPEMTFSEPENALEALTVDFDFDSGVPVLPDGSMLLRPVSIAPSRLEIPIQEERRLPVWMPFPFLIDTQSTFELPPGYTAEIPDEATTLTGPGMRFQGFWSVGDRPSEIVWRERLIVEAIDVQVEQYEDAREFARTLHARVRDGIVARRQLALPQSDAR